MKKLNLVSAALVAGVMVAGCGNKEAPKSTAPDTAADQKAAQPAEQKAAQPAANANETVIEVNGQALTRGELDADVAKIVESQKDQIPADQLDYARAMYKNQLARNFLMQGALVAKAKQLGFAVTEEDVKARKDEMLKAFASRPDAPKTFDEFLEKFPLGKERGLKEFENGILIDKMIKAETEKDTTDYSVEAKAKIAEIVSNNVATASSDADALKKIQALKAELDSPACTNVAVRFGELAEANSDCPSGKRAKGDLDFFTHGQMVKEFDQAAFSLPVGKVSDPVKTDFGYHLIMVTDKKAAVEAAGDKPAEPEKVRCSHILVKTQKPAPVPTEEEMVKNLKMRASRKVIPAFIEAAIRECNPKAAEEFKDLLPAEAKTPLETPSK